jgi:prepilin peptidase CpaA
MTSGYVALSESVLIITAAVLFYIALTDLKEFKIRNELIIVLVGLFFFHAVMSGRWVSIYWNIAVAAIVFAIMLFHYSQKMMGGGDVKLLTVAFLWVGVTYALPFTLLLLAFAVVHAIVAWLGWANVQQTGRRKRIPFAPSIAGALIGTFVCSFLLNDPAMNRTIAFDLFARGPASLPPGAPLSVDELKRSLGIVPGEK